ncbi:armadillo-type protein [Chytriomyces sp. MP71]|nr:armadillo-type protein [Chytriomyces sp. MP71]
MSAIDETTGSFTARPVTQSDLLQWAIVNKATAKEDAPARVGVPEKREPIDPKWVDVILGKSDSVRMKECVAILVDDAKELAVKLAAFDELEMLVESLDNANDMRNLGLWKPIISILASHAEPEMRAFAAWVLGTCVQNNPTAQKDFLAAQGLPVLLKSLQSDTDPEVRAKAMTCLSGLVRHNRPAYAQLAALALGSNQLGLAPVRALVASPGAFAKAQKRAVFFLDGLVSGGSGEEDEVIAMAVADAQAGDWAGAVVELLETSAKLDKDLVDKCLSLLMHLASRKAILDATTLAKLRTVIPATIAKFSTPSTSDEDDEGLDANLCRACSKLFI